MSTRNELREYARTQDELVRAITAWGAAHPGVEVDLHFPQEDVIAPLSAYPAEWCGNEATLDLVQYCIGRVPTATIGMLRSISQQLARAH